MTGVMKDGSGTATAPVGSNRHLLGHRGYLRAHLRDVIWGLCRMVPVVG